MCELRISPSLYRVKRLNSLFADSKFSSISTFCLLCFEITYVGTVTSYFRFLSALVLYNLMINSTAQYNDVSTPSKPTDLKCLY